MNPVTSVNPDELLRAPVLELTGELVSRLPRWLAPSTFPPPR